MRKHEDGNECWCNPYVYIEFPNGGVVMVHREINGVLPPAKLLAEAIAMAFLEDQETEDDRLLE